MNKQLPEELDSAKKINKFARRNYRIYKEHFESRNMIPTLTLDDFLKNYSTT